MRKIITIALCLIATFALQCKKEEAATDTALTDSTVTGTIVSGTAAPGTPPTAFRLTTTPVTVVFEGMVAHVLGGGVTRAIIPRVTGHPRTLIMPVSVKTDFEAAFGTTCGGSCSAVIDGHAFRVVDMAGNPSSSAFMPSFTFTRAVTKLSAVPSAEAPFASAADLVPDISEPGPKPASVVAGFFELIGGKGNAVAFSCGAKFQGQAVFDFFAKSVEVRFDMPAGGAKLQVLKPAHNGDWTRAATINLPAAGITITVDNDLKNSLMSHFDNYAMLSIKTSSGGGMVNLPDVVVDPSTEPFCDFGGLGGRPGCSNSQFP